VPGDGRGRTPQDWGKHDSFTAGSRLIEKGDKALVDALAWRNACGAGRIRKGGVGNALRPGRVGVMTREDQQFVRVQVREIEPALARIVVIETQLGGVIRNFGGS
jgi:hypothetical protein